jgi:hypothetical protein
LFCGETLPEYLLHRAIGNVQGLEQAKVLCLLQFLAILRKQEAQLRKVGYLPQGLVVLNLEPHNPGMIDDVLQFVSSFYLDPL